MEMVWCVAPLSGLLSQLGGTYKKQYRRIGNPTLFTITHIICRGISPTSVYIWFLYFGVTTLPFTLIGDSIEENWLNWIWIGLWAGLLALPSILLGYSTSWLISYLIAVSIIYISCTLSNLKSTAYYFPWKWCEFLVYAMVAYPFCLSLLS